MGRNDLCITVPSFFKCPISLDVMKSPVSLCTGVTYDRSSIQRWLDGGNNTCPATMQVLQTKEVVPNHTLHRLIQTWSDSFDATNAQKNQVELEKHPTSVDLPENLPQILSGVRDGQAEALRRVANIVLSGEKNRDALVSEGAVEALVGVFQVRNGIKLLQDVVKALGLILPAVRSDRRAVYMLTTPDAIDSFTTVLDRGDDSEAVAECARVIEWLASQADSHPPSVIFVSDAVISSLVKAMSGPDSIVSLAAVSCVATIATARRNRARIVRLGAVSAVSRLLLRADFGDSAATEKAMKVLELASSCAEGRAAISESSSCVSAIVEKLLKFGTASTESGVVTLWSVCCASHDRRAAEAASRSNGVAKVLLLMQSNCSPGVRQMAGDLLKTLRTESKDSLLRYDSKTAHIMPF